MYYFIVNEHGGSGMVRRNWHKINTYLKGNNIEYKCYKTNDRYHANALTKKISMQDISVDNDIKIIAVGGDGTINEVINGITDFERVKLGVLPLGSANDFANGIGISLSPIAALESILNAKEAINVDIGKISTDSGESRLFGISSGLGMDAYVCKKALNSKLKNVLNYVGLGGTVYVALTVLSLMELPEIEAEVYIDDKESVRFRKMVFLAAMNMPIEGGGVPMAPGANARDGMLTMCCGHDAGKLKALTVFPKLKSGNHEGLSFFTIRDFKRMEIHTRIPVELHADGEYGGKVSKTVIECLPGKLKLLM